MPAVHVLILGVLAPSGTADDEAVFVDLKTARVIARLAHGHTDVTEPGAESGVLAVEGDNVVANASVLPSTEITPDNNAAFHFHESPDSFPWMPSSPCPTTVNPG